MKIDILGTKYEIKTRKVSEDALMKTKSLAGYCSEEGKYIVIADMSEKEYFPDMGKNEQKKYKKRVLRHELIHAFLNESGLSDNACNPSGAWANNEEMIDWIAIQFPKIFKAFRDAGAI